MDTSQAPQAPQPDQSAASTLGSVAGGIPLAADAAAQQVTSQAAPATTPQAAPTPQPAPTNSGSRLSRIISAVANVGATALQSVSDKGRPSFLTGAGEGARAEKQQEQLQQEIKFRDFDSQLRLAQLHNQDLKMQQDTEAQKDAHTKAELDNRALANSLGIQYDTLPSDGDAVMDHLKSQTAATGSASVPSGTHLSGGGDFINIPRNDQATQDGQKQMYSMLAPALGLSPLPPNAQFVPPQNMNMLTNKIHGFDIAGKPIQHQDLPGAIGSLQLQRDQMAKNGAPTSVLQAMDNTLGIYKANLDALDKHDADVKAKNKQAELDVENSPANVTASSNKTAQNEQAKLNVQNSPANVAASAKAAAAKTAAEQSVKSTGELNAVAFDPNYQNPDGTKGANVVMNKSDAQQKGLQHYKADPAKLNATIAGFNDVQNKINALAAVTTDPKRMSSVQGPTAAILLKQGFGLELGAFGTKLDLSNINTAGYEAQLSHANQATRDYVTAMGAAHEAITQLPRLQTFGQSSRMTQQQMEAAQKMLPAPGDDAGMAAQKMQALQTTIDPLRKQVPHMQGADTIPSWLETRQQQQRQRQTPSGPSNLGRVVTGNATDFINGLQ